MIIPEYSNPLEYSGGLHMAVRSRATERGHPVRSMVLANVYSQRNSATFGNDSFMFHVIIRTLIYGGSGSASVFATTTGAGGVGGEAT